jgi:CRP/FNR family transcriptional regulator
MVFSGKVKIQMLGANAKEQIVRLAKAGDVIGYRSMIRGENYNASAEALEETTVCFLSKETFFELLSNNFPVSMNLMKLLSENLGDAETKMVGVLQKPTKNRIAETILVLKDLYGTEADSQTLNIVMTREEIANYAGMSTETAIRILYDLRGDGVIALEKKKIKILNFQKLIQISGAND